MNAAYWLIIIVALLGFIVQGKLQSVFAKYSKVPFLDGTMTGRDVAEKMLRDNGITNVTVQATRGQLTDNFNPSNMTINLSESVYGSTSVAAAAVAAHECGHAVQHATGYAPIKLRSALVPVVSFSSRWATWVIIAGIFVLHTFPALFWVGIGMLVVAVVFSLVTLPVEYNASERALAWLQGTEKLNQTQYGQAKEALRWAARTYLAAAVSSVATIIYFLGFARNR